MKIRHIIIFSFALFLVSCNRKQSYELANLSHPLLDEWFANFKAADSSFSAEKFEQQFYSDNPNESTEEWYDLDFFYEPDSAQGDIISPNRDFYLNLDFYSGLDDALETGIYTGGEVDSKTTLVDVRNKKAIDIIPVNCCNDAMDAFWVNDSIFVMLCQELDASNDEWVPYISIWKRELLIGYYIYAGKINNFRDDKFFPFYKRLQRLGITIAE